MPEIKLELTEHEIEFLHQIHNAQAIKEMTHHPGWRVLQQISANIIERMENQHLEFAGKGTRDAYWLSGARLAGARTYAKVLMERVIQEVGFTEQDIIPPNGKLKAEEMDGDYGAVDRD